MRVRRTYTTAVILLILEGTTGQAGTVGPKANQVPAIDAASAGNPAVAVVPFVNYADDLKAREIFLPLINTRLERENIRLFPDSELHEILRKHRIRTTGAISGAGVKIISAELPVDYLLLGSIDVFIEGEIPEAGFSVRLLDMTSGQIVWAVSVAATGDDFTGLFGLGRITSMEKLAGKLVEAAFAGFGRALAAHGRQETSTRNARTYALVPFDNLSEYKQAGNIITAHVLSELIARGEHVIEPGLIEELCYRHNRVPRGEVDLALLESMRDSLGIDLVITGSVAQFNPGNGAPHANPEIELGGRCISAENGRILGAYECTRRGIDSETIFGMGIKHSIGKLSDGIVRTLLNKIENKEK